jgi:putative endonuclease
MDEPPHTGSKQHSGAQHERLAEQHLIAHGLVPLLRNFRARLGELDLVMRDRGTLVVVEVRSRAPTRYGAAAETIGPGKRARIVAATKVLLAARPELARLPVRFDVVAFDGDAAAPQWIRSAFDAR